MALYLFGGLTLAVLGAYACRVDGLTWWRHPVLMALHVAGGIAAAWAMHAAAVQAVAWLHAAALAWSVLVLVATWRSAGVRNHRAADRPAEDPR